MTREFAPQVQAGRGRGLGCRVPRPYPGGEGGGGPGRGGRPYPKYGSLHTEAIITGDYINAQRFLREVDSSVVMVNASTRFSDGNQLGLGAEIGISTTKLHSFGPMGLEDLTTRKFIVLGEGQVRS